MDSYQGSNRGIIHQAVSATRVDRVWERFMSVFQGTQSGGQNPSQFTPGTPLLPIAPEAQPRQNQYQVGYNIIYTPRSGFQTSFEQLRFFADYYDIARICINRRIEQMAGMQYDVIAAEEGTGDHYKTEIRNVKAFLEMPDREHDWQTWMGMWLEDSLVCDAACLFPRPNRRGGLYALEPIDGTTIKPLIDVRGKIPDPPAPAYQQILYGRPNSQFSAKELMYLPRHRRTKNPYGFSEIESIIYIVNTALRKRLMDLSHFTDSNIPRALLGVPPDWKPAQLREYQNFVDEFLAGDIPRRSRMILTPAMRGGVPIHEFAPFSGDPQFDNYLLKLTCAALHVTPSEIGFTDDVNRATAGSQEDVTFRDAINPMAKFIKGIMDRVIRDYMGFRGRDGRPVLQFKWIFGQNSDEMQEAQRSKIFYDMGVYQLDELREQQGLTPFGLEPFIVIGGQPIFISQLKQMAQQKVGGQSLLGALAAKKKGGPNDQDENGNATNIAENNAEGIDGNQEQMGTGIGNDNDVPTANQSASNYNQDGLQKVIAPNFAKRDDIAGTTQFTLPVGLANLIKTWRSVKIPEAALMEDHPTPYTPHITVCYGLTDGAVLGLDDVVDGVQKIPAMLGRTRVFEGPDHDVVYIEVLSVELHALNALIRANSSVNTSHHDYTPHVTVAYVPSGMGHLFADDDFFAGRRLMLQQLEVWYLSSYDPEAKKPHTITLGGAPDPRRVVPMSPFIGAFGASPFAMAAGSGDLKLWQRKIMKAVKSGGRIDKPFVSDNIPEDVAAKIHERMVTIQAMPKDQWLTAIKDVFAETFAAFMKADVTGTSLTFDDESSMAEIKRFLQHNFRCSFIGDQRFQAIGSSFARVMTAFHNAGVDMSPYVDTIQPRSTKHGKPYKAFMAYSPVTKTIYFNAAWFVGDMRLAVGYIRDKNERGINVGQNEDAVIAHELGHALHVHSFDDRREALNTWPPQLNVNLDAVSQRVSKYASKGPREFIGEVYAGSATGVQYAPEVIELYKSLQGPPLLPGILREDAA